MNQWTAADLMSINFYTCLHIHFFESLMHNKKVICMFCIAIIVHMPGLLNSNNMLLGVDVLTEVSTRG